ncbi:hypothetical protein B0H10DRAFT_2230628 [Mycena sp. CBHHK59/15]|nr:hypothetical protein B0H10DRAFT_2230628 [Mycena sp. CBHHK59/15]
MHIYFVLARSFCACAAYLAYFTFLSSLRFFLTLTTPLLHRSDARNPALSTPDTRHVRRAPACLLSWFLDVPPSPFGVHRMALAGTAQLVVLVPVPVAPRTPYIYLLFILFPSTLAPPPLVSLSSTLSSPLPRLSPSLTCPWDVTRRPCF